VIAFGYVVVRRFRPLSFVHNVVMSLWYDWRTDTIRFTTKMPKSTRGDWDTCGVHRKRDGQPCQGRALDNGRCKYHGGLSTGPRTRRGKARALANLKQFRSAEGSHMKNYAD
jgi:hypothetical protein